MTLAPVTDILEPGELTLGELAERAIHEHEATGAALVTAVSHGIACGEILLQAHERVGPEAWDAWVKENLTFTRQLAYRYQRLAHYREALPPEAFATYTDAQGGRRYPSITRAMTYVRGLPQVRPFSPPMKHDPEVVREAQRLRKAGISYSAIGEMLGISHSAAHRHCDPSYRRRQAEASRRYLQRRRRADKALRDQERKRELAAIGGALADAYSFIRRAAQQLDEARSQTKGAQAKALSDALTHLHHTEDAIGRALRLENAPQ